MACPWAPPSPIAYAHSLPEPSHPGLVGPWPLTPCPARAVVKEIAEALFEPRRLSRTRQIACNTIRLRLDMAARQPTLLQILLVIVLRRKEPHRRNNLRDNRLGVAMCLL